MLLIEGGTLEKAKLEAQRVAAADSSVNATASMSVCHGVQTQKPACLP